MENIAVIGASKDKEKFSNKCVRAYNSKGYNVYPVNPNETEIEGLKCYSNIMEIKENIDIVSIYLNGENSHKVVDSIIEKKPSLVYINPDAADNQVEWKIKNAGIRVKKECSILAIGIRPSSL